MPNHVTDNQPDEMESGREARVHSDTLGTEWTPEKNARRVALINKKHDKRLTLAEKRELVQLMAEAEEHRDAVVPPGNDSIELILAGLESQAAKSSKQ